MPKPAMHTVQTWDFSWVFGMVKNGTTTPAAPAWQVYDDHPILLTAGDTLVVNALRIGYKQAEVKWVY